MKRIILSGLVLVIMLATAGIVVAGNQAQEHRAMFRLSDVAPANLDKGEAVRTEAGSLNRYTNRLDTIEVPADSSGGPIYSNVVLKEGKTYILRASGTADAGANIEFDAKYSIREGCSMEGWTDLVCGYEYLGETLLDLQVDGNTPEWGEYSPIHVYTTEIVGDGTTIELEIYDTYPSNNTGSLTVEIYPHNALGSMFGHAVEVAPGVFYLGKSMDKGKVVEGYAFIHYAKDSDKAKKAKPVWDDTWNKYKFLFPSLKLKWADTYDL